jgi:hypothetical protein
VSGALERGGLVRGWDSGKADRAGFEDAGLGYGF